MQTMTSARLGIHPPGNTALKARYDPGGRAPHLYDKCVRRV